MKRILLLFLSGIFLFTASCDKLGKNKKGDDQNTDSLIEIIPGDILKGGTNISGSAELAKSREVTEAIPGAEISNLVAMKDKDTSMPREEKIEDVPQPETTPMEKPSKVEPQTTAPKKEEKIPEEPMIGTSPAGEGVGDREVKPPVKTTVQTQPEKEQPAAQPTYAKVSGKKGCYIKLGSDTKSQYVSPRSYKKLTMVVFNPYKYGRRVEFQAYAVPVGSKLSRRTYYMIAVCRNIEIVNGQAQLTKFWNGRNINGQFLPKGKYNIYLYYKIKNSSGKVIATSGRYWGGSRSYYINLH